MINKQEAAMYICICNAVSDQVIREEIRNGTSDVKTLAKKYNVAQACGRCASAFRSLVSEAANGAK